MTKEQYWADKDERARVMAAASAAREGSKAFLLYMNAVQEEKANARRARRRLKNKSPMKANGLRYYGNVKV